MKNINSIESLYGSALGFNTISYIISNTKTSETIDEAAMGLESATNDLSFFDNFMTIDSKLTNDKIKMVKRLNANYGRLNKSLESYCMSMEEEAKAEQVESKNTDTSAKSSSFGEKAKKFFKNMGKIILKFFQAIAKMIKAIVNKMITLLDKASGGDDSAKTGDKDVDKLVSSIEDAIEEAPTAEQMRIRASLDTAKKKLENVKSADEAAIILKSTVNMLKTGKDQGSVKSALDRLVARRKDRIVGKFMKVQIDFDVFDLSRFNGSRAEEFADWFMAFVDKARVEAQNAARANANIDSSMQRNEKTDRFTKEIKDENGKVTKKEEHVTNEQLKAESVIKRFTEEIKGQCKKILDDKTYHIFERKLNNPNDNSVNFNTVNNDKEYIVSFVEKLFSVNRWSGSNSSGIHTVKLQELRKIVFGAASRSKKTNEIIEFDKRFSNKIDKAVSGLDPIVKNLDDDFNSDSTSDFAKKMYALLKIVGTVMKTLQNGFMLINKCVMNTENPLRVAVDANN